MPYPESCECLFPGFVKRIVVLSQKGYFFYVTGTAEYNEEKKRKKPALRALSKEQEWAAIDASIIAKFETKKSPQQRQRKKAKGEANCMYFRQKGTPYYVMMATHGTHRFYDAHDIYDAKEQPEGTIFDIRERPIRRDGYSIGLRPDGAAKNVGVKKLRAGVRFTDERYKEMKDWYLERCIRVTKEKFEEMVKEDAGRLYHPYAPVYRQMKGIIRDWRISYACIERKLISPAHFAPPTPPIRLMLVPKAPSNPAHPA
jgi:hypothetical protein